MSIQVLPIICIQTSYIITLDRIPTKHITLSLRWYGWSWRAGSTTWTPWFVSGRGRTGRLTMSPTWRSSLGGTSRDRPLFPLWRSSCRRPLSTLGRSSRWRPLLVLRGPWVTLRRLPRWRPLLTLGRSSRRGCWHSGTPWLGLRTHGGAFLRIWKLIFQNVAC